MSLYINLLFLFLFSIVLKKSFEFIILIVLQYLGGFFPLHIPNIF